MSNLLTHKSIFLMSAIGVLVAGSVAASSPSFSTAAILAGLAGVGFTGIITYYIFVQGAVDNN